MYQRSCLLIESSSSEEEPQHDTDDDCPHGDRDEVGTCTRCGHWMSIAHNRHNAPIKKSSLKSIMKDIENYPISEDLKRKANSIYMDVIAAGAKKKSRKKLVCFCLDQAGRSLPESMLSSLQIAHMVGVDEGKVIEAIKYYGSPSNTSYRGVGNYSEPLDLIHNYGRQMKLTAVSINMIKEDYVSLVTRNPELKEKPPVTTIAALIYCYKKTNGLHIDQQEFFSIFGYRFSTIESMGGKLLVMQNT
jgi:hypothetical protein